MELNNTAQRYGLISQLFHWVMALLVIGLIVIGLYMVRLPINAWKLKLYGLHKEWGVLVLMMVALRLLWRFTQISPEYPLHMPLWQKLAAKSVHVAFYFFLFALPISGWMLSSASGLPVSFFGLFVMPDLVGPNQALRELLTQVHKWLGYGLIAALGAHVGAALQHHFIHKDDILRRMLP
ncbi:MAG: cytochrome b [Proteobacteria bacterium]|nr:cytochrome b [Pseudomonadota bacterium]